ncbi:AfsR/SARP family transcriptional regulator [Actinomadura atramentaria]|uniref:AfsR/SARP family transcriptional regulator n=1 Tax=Actinomadura atramentaria TaxID=1990 RepID=UPI00037350A4|nr:AfsR/SARP family transcriptional regulator [Actinomadura atramentaria]
MEVAVLGPLLLSDGRQSFNIRAAKLRTLLALLALNAGQVVTADELIDELWGEKPLSDAKNSLQANIARLRRILADLRLESPEDPLVRTVDNGYMLAVADEDVDSTPFLRRADRAISLVNARPEEAIALLRAALGLWRGSALLNVVEGPRCRAAALALDERRKSAQEDLITARLQAGNAREVVPELRELISQHPERERFSEQLMLALYRCGRQSEAIDVFHRTRNWLDRELGLLPGRGLSRIYQAILVQEPL